MILKRLLIATAVLTTIIIGTALAIVLQPQLLRPLIAKGGQHFAGLEIDIGRMESHRNPSRLEIGDLAIRNPAWENPVLLQLGELSLSLLHSPFGSEPFWTLKLHNVDIFVEQAQDGRLNWLTTQLDTPSATDTEAEADQPENLLPADFNFRDFELANVSLHLKQGDEPAQVFTLENLHGQRLEKAKGEFRARLDYRQQQIDLRTSVNLFDPVRGILDFSLAIEHPDLALNSAGRLSLKEDLAGSTLQLDAQLSGVEQLNGLLEDFGTTLPPLPVSKLSTRLKVDDRFHLDTLQLQVGDNRLTGQLDSSRDFLQQDIRLASDNLDIDALLSALSDDNDPADIAPEGGDNAAPESLMDWQWLNQREVSLTFSNDSLAVSGWQIEGLTLSASLNKTLSLDLSADHLREQASGRVIPDLSMQAQLTPREEKVPGADADLDLQLRQQDTQLSASGAINLNGTAGNDIALSLRSPNSRAIWQLALLDWREAGALTLDGRLSTGEHITIDLAAALGEQQARANLNITPGDITGLEGKLALHQIDLEFINPPAADGAPSAATSSGEKTAGKPGRLLDDTPLPWEFLRQYQGGLSLQLTDIDTGYTLIRRANLSPRLTEGRLALTDGRIEFEDGNAQLDSLIDAAGAQTTMQLKLQLDSDNYGGLGLEKAAGILGGSGGVRVDLNGRGNSPAQLAASLSGQIDMKVRNLRAQGNALDLIGSDVLTKTIDKLNPFAEKKAHTDIECIAVHFKGQRGEFFSRQGIAVETEATKILGTGNIDLGNEELLFSVTPIARQGVGVNLGAAAGLVRLGGTFSDPHVEMDPGGVLSSGLSTSAAIYTGGLSILAQGLLKRALYAGSACDGELQEIPTLEALPEQIELPQPSPAGEPLESSPPAATTSSDATTPVPSALPVPAAELP